MAAEISTQQAVARTIANVNCYNPDSKRRIQAELTALLQQILSLNVQVAQLVHDNGSTSSLVQLFGTIPIFYKGAQYNIPVTVWLLESYPQVPPKCYVTPTPDMRIKDRHRHVDQSGTIYLPYLHHWKAATSNLDELVSYMSSVFSDDPPVYRYDGPPAPVAARPVVIVQPPINNNNNNNKPAQVPALASPRSASPINPRRVSASPSMEEMSAAAALKERLVNEVTNKIQRAFTQFNKDFTRELDDLFDKQQRLAQSGTKIVDLKASLKAQQSAMTRTLESLTKSVPELEQWLAANEVAADIDVDAAVVPEDVWSRQMFDAVAGDFAIEDALYALDRAIQDERIDLQTYLKQVRKLARAQFFHRALALKIVSRQAAINQEAPSALASAPAPPPFGRVESDSFGRPLQRQGQGLPGAGASAPPPLPPRIPQFI